MQLLFHPFIIGLILAIGAIAFTASTFDLPQLSVDRLGFDDHLIYDDFEKDYIDTNKWTYIQKPTKAEYGTCSSEELWERARTNHDVDYINIKDGAFHVSAEQPYDCRDSNFCDYHWDDTASNRPDAYQHPEILILEPTKKLYGKSLKFKARIEGRHESFYPDPRMDIMLNGENVYSMEGSGMGSEAPDDVYEEVISIEPSFLHQDVFTIRSDAEYVKTVNVSGGSSEDFQIIYRPGFEDERSSYTDLYIDYVKYKYPYSCEIHDDETLVFDSFAAGSQVNISTLSFEPERFCLGDYPLKARSFEENGIRTDTRGETLKQIVRGQSMTVPENEEWKVYYITEWNESMELRCDIDEAYNTQTGECVNPNKQQLYECETDSDCYIPPGCTGLSASCLPNNTCSYSGSCEPETIVEEKPVYVDQCETDADCEAPCEGMSATCEETEAPNGTYQRCAYSGECDPDVVQCQQASDCPPAPCDGMTRTCMDNTCSYEGECEPETATKEQPFAWDRLVSWLTGLFN